MNRQLLLTIMGEHNLKLTEFATKRLIELAEVQANWDGRDAEPMNETSLRQLCYFLSKITEPIPIDIGFFFNHEGSMSINWLLDNAVVDICFEPEATYLYMTGYDDGIALPKKVFPTFKYTNPEECIQPYKGKLELVSSVLYKLESSVAQQVVNLIAYDYGWGEHGDELEMNTEALHSFVQFIAGLDDDPGKLILFMTQEGYLELVLMGYDPRHEIEFTPEGLLFFTAPEYDMTEVLKENFNNYTNIKQFLTGEIK